MIINLSRFEILEWMEGCLMGSHLRQGIWDRAINEMYTNLDDDQRNFIFHYAVRDFWDRAKKRSYVWEEGFEQFIARFNPDAQYKLKEGCSLPDNQKAEQPFMYQRRLYVNRNRFYTTEAAYMFEKDNSRLDLYWEKYRSLYYEISKKLTLSCAK